MNTFTKPLPGILDYGFDYSRWLNGDTITSSTWMADDGITIGLGHFDDSATYVDISGGQVGYVYRLINEITTASGLVDRRSFRVRVVEYR